MASEGHTVVRGRRYTIAVDLSAAVVDMLAARQDFAINLKVLQTADRMERRALDILA